MTSTRSSNRVRKSRINASDDSITTSPTSANASIAKKRTKSTKTAAVKPERSTKRKVSRTAKQSIEEEHVEQEAEEEEEEEEEEEDRKYYLMKSEPETRIQDGIDMKFSIDDLGSEPNSTTHWDGVRNHEAKNIMKEMKVGDRAFFYHSNTRKTRPCIAGEMEVVKLAYVDHTAFDKDDPHYDVKSNKDNPKWFMVDVKLIRKFDKVVSLDDIKQCDDLKDMQLVKRARISVQRVMETEWDFILKMAGEDKDEKH